jgi:hypothetical protein
MGRRFEICAEYERVGLVGVHVLLGGRVVCDVLDFEALGTVGGAYGKEILESSTHARACGASCRLGHIAKTSSSNMITMEIWIFGSNIAFQGGPEESWAKLVSVVLLLAAESARSIAFRMYSEKEGDFATLEAYIDAWTSCYRWSR